MTIAVSNTKDLLQGSALVSLGENGHSGQTETTGKFHRVKYTGTLSQW